MKRYEHCHQVFPLAGERPADALVAFLDQRSADGWELVHASLAQHDASPLAIPGQRAAPAFVWFLLLRRPILEHLHEQC